MGSHPEYATPECDSILDLVTHDKAGERILEQLLVAASRQLRDEGIRGSVYLFKNNTDSAGNSYGCHENYLTSRRDDLGHCRGVDPVLRVPADLRGAGKVLQTARVQCSASPSGPSMWEGVSSATARMARSSTPATSPSRRRSYRRLHVIVGDSNMSEYTTFLKVGTTSILLRMLEDPTYVVQDMTLENPIRAIRDIGHDPTMKRLVRLANGREASALDIQSEYLERAQHYTETRNVSPLEAQALQMWEHCLHPPRRRPAVARP